MCSGLVTSPVKLKAVTVKVLRRPLRSSVSSLIMIWKLELCAAVILDMMPKFIKRNNGPRVWHLSELILAALIEDHIKCGKLSSYNNGNELIHSQTQTILTQLSTVEHIKTDESVYYKH